MWYNAYIEYWYVLFDKKNIRFEFRDHKTLKILGAEFVRIAGYLTARRLDNTRGFMSLQAYGRRQAQRSVAVWLQN